jgi:hypothetical protein
MATFRNYGVFLFVCASAWRVVACTASTGGGGDFAGAGGFVTSSSGGVPSGAQPGSGGALSMAGASNNGGTTYINLNQGGGGGGVNLREQDSSCHPLSETPEKIVITDSSVVTDTITTLTPVALFIMQDRTGSMSTGFPSGCACSWDNSTAALTAFVKDPMSAGLDVGLSFFGGSDKTQCNGSDCGQAVVPIEPIAMAAQPIISAMQANKPPGSNITPLECGLRGMVNACLQFMSNSPAGEKCVAVLVTDGNTMDPTPCDGNVADLVQIVTDGHSKGVDTYTLGLQGSDPNFLDQLAQAGGTMAHIDASASVDAFVAALNSIRGKVSHQDKHTIQSTKVIETPLRCQWKIPPPQMNEPPLDPTKVNVLYTPPGQPGQQFGHVPCDTTCSADQPAAACPPNGQAWYYDSEKMPTQVFLCPSTCAAIKTVMDARIDLQFHCPQKPYVVQ